jgi:hypothetical protein
MSVGSAHENSTSQNFTGARCADDHRANKAVVAPTGSSPALPRAVQATAGSSVTIRHSDNKIRDPEIWRKTKEGVGAAKGFTFDLLKDLAKGFVKKQIEDYTGVKL